MCLVLIYSLVSLKPFQVSSQDNPLNIVLIFADDLGYGDLGCYGNPTIRTPHLDQLASAGMKFTQFYTGASVCTPSRAALLTGRLPVRFGLADNRMRVFFPFSLSGIPEDEITLAEALKDHNYATSLVGKWHLGHKDPYLPTKHGFDEFYGIPYSNDMSPVTTPWVVAQKFPPLPFMDGTEVIETEPDQRNLTPRYTQRACDFISRNKDRPFFLYYSHNFPHVPLFASEEFRGKSSRGLYGDVVEELDWSVGEIMRVLKEEGLEENTLVIFTSDNGPWLTQGNEGGTAGLLKQGKGSTYEGGMRVPAIMRLPGKIPQGVTSQAMATTMDLFVTILSLAGVKIGEKDFDGIDLTPTLMDGREDQRNEVFYYLGSELYAVRQGPWKIHFKTLNPYVGESPQVHDPPLLYHLDHDPSERFNIANKNPDIVQKLTNLAENFTEGISPMPSRMMEWDRSMVPTSWYSIEKE